MEENKHSKNDHYGREFLGFILSISLSWDFTGPAQSTTVQWAQIEKVLFLARGLGTGTLQDRDVEENFKIFLFYSPGLLHVKPQS